MTGAEKLLWSRLRRKRIGGLRFRRQVPLGAYFADFVCLSAKLIAEVDGETHYPSGRAKYDRRRTLWLGCNGFHVIRFSNAEVASDLDFVVATIVGEARRLHPAASYQTEALPPPPPEEGGGGGQGVNAFG